MSAEITSPSLKGRLEDMTFDRSECVAALRGESIPTALGLPLIRLCIIRGLRYHEGYGHEMRGVLPGFTRALNAREIMSNRIPEIKSPEEVPYCIWHPETATEATYRELARVYPQMAYQVGRACAVAGYTKLYDELDIFPDTHIAEEARECGNMAIFDNVMSKPVRYAITNDYERTIDGAVPKIGFLNGDTAVRRSLDFKQAFRDAKPMDEDNWDFLDADDGYDERIFNITEEISIDEHATPIPVEKNLVMADLLHQPLPPDLPTVDKDLLILMAAYSGNIDRYARLRRPSMIVGELECCIWGIHQQTMFAVWWSKQDLANVEGRARLDRAITARFIMNNSLSRVLEPAGSEDEPYLIWYPTIASPSTYGKLADLRSSMLPQIIRACIVGNHQALFDELVVRSTPDQAMLEEAARSPITYYAKALESRANEVGGVLEIKSFDSRKLQSHTQLTFSQDDVCKFVSVHNMLIGFDSLYGPGTKCDPFEIELIACIPSKWVLPDDTEDNLIRFNYRN